MPYVLGLGELLWDLLPAGPQLGGAPANFAIHARALGADAALVTRIGRDARGREALARLAAAGVSTDLVQEDPDTPTGTVGVSLAAGGQPAFTIHGDVAWDRIAATASALAAAARADADALLAARRRPGSLLSISRLGVDRQSPAPG